MRIATRFLLCSIVLSALAGFTTMTFASSAKQRSASSGKAISATDRITQSIDETNLVTLGLNTRPEANAKNDRGAVADSLTLDHLFILLQRSPEQEQELNALIDQLNDRNSPNFHQWLTAQQFGERFGVSTNDLDTVTRWLESHGFQVNQVYPSRMLIDVSGAAGQIREAFHTEIHNLEVAGETHLANMSDPQIPEALAPVVKGFASLNDFKPHPMYKSAAQYSFASCAASTGSPTEPGTCYAVTPQDNQTIYNLNPLYNAGISGQGQTIVLVEDTDTYGGAADWNSYRSAFGLSTAFPQGSYTQVHPGGCTDPGTNGDDGEAAIDVEVASGIAPSAAIELISCGSGTFTFGGLIALQNLINASSTPPAIASVSYGVCEVYNGAGGNAAFYNTYQQAASEGVSVFVSSGDEGSSSCSGDFSAGSQYDVTSLGVTGWGETPYNVVVGGTDFEDVYNSKEGGAPLSSYWSPTNTSGYGSALSYIPEIPWNDACASVLIAEVATGSFTTFGASPAICNNATFDTSTTYLSTGAGSGGASNCATGAAGANQSSYLITSPECQGYAKPSYQSGSTLSGGQAVYGQPSDGLRDIPDVSMFAANGVWGHFETVCWSDPAYTADGAASCTGAPSSWSGFGGTSVASPTMAAIQSLVNQKTGQSWGNPNPIYYQIAQNEYGTAGGSFLGGSCNSSGTGGPASGCAFNDVTQGDIDSACEYNGTTEEAHCYKPTGTHGVDSTDNVTAAAIINGGSGYTTAPSCVIAGPTNSSPYLSPTGATLWAGGTQAACTAAVSSATTTAKWTITISSSSAAGQQVTVGPNTFTLSGTSTSTIASNLSASINSGSTVATATVSSKTVTATAKVTGYAGNFNVSTGTGFLFGAGYLVITNTTLGQGPNYVSGITITTAGSGYQPDTPITLTGGGGSGAVAVANTSIGTGAQSYQPTYGAAPGYDLATGLGTPNAYNLVCSIVWGGSACAPIQQSQTITFTTNAPASAAYNNHFTVAATATSGLAVAYTSAGSCSNVGATYTVTSGTGSCSVIANQSGNASYSAAPTVTETVNATTASQTINFTANAPASAAYNSNFTVAASATSGLAVAYTSAGSCSNVGATYTMTTGAGSCSVIANQSGNANYAAAATVTESTIATKLSASLAVTSVSPSSEDYGSIAPVAITAMLSWTGTGSAPTGAVTIAGNGPGSYGATTCGAASGDTLTCSATYTPTGADPLGNYTESASFAGDGNYSAASSGQSNNFAVNQATTTTTITSSGTPSTYGQSVTLTANINGENNFLKGKPGKRGGKPTVGGTVAWSANTGCGTTAVTSGNPGLATCTTASLAVGGNSITATYSGDGNHSGSVGTFSQVVSAATTSIAVSSVTPASEDYGSTAPVSITAVLSWTGSGAAPTAADVAIGGNGNGSYGTTTCGAASGTTLTCSATYAPSGTETPGSYTETAAFSGDASYSGSTSPQTNNFAVNAAASTTAVSSTPNPSTYATQVVFTATISGENNFVKGRAGKNGAKRQDLTGTVIWSSNTACGTTAVTSGNPGIATCTTSSATHLPVGTDVVTATYSGDSNHGGSAGSVNQVVQGGIATTIDVTGVSPSAEDFGADSPITITALLSWAGHGTAPTASDVTIGGSGLGTYGSTSCAARVNDTITCTATYTPSNSDVPGTYTETAAFSGDTNYAGSSSPETNNFTINSASSATALSSSLNPSTYGQSVTFTAAVSGEFNFAKGRAGKNGARGQDVTGTVSWSSNTGCGTTAVTSGNPGVATCTTTILPVGSADTIVATYSGDSNHGGSGATLSQQVNSASYTVTWPTPSPITYGTALSSAQLDATSSINGAFVYTPPSGTVLNAGTQTLSVTFTPSDSNYSPTTTTVSLLVNPASTTVTWPTPAAITYGTALSATQLNATTGVSGTFVYSPGAGTVLNAGAQTLSVTFTPASNNYSGSTGSVSLTVNPASTTVTWPTPAAITYGTALSATQLDATTGVSGTFVYSPGAGTVLNAGAQTLSVTFTPASNNYSGSTGSVSLTVNPASTTVTWSTPAAITYGTALSSTQLNATASQPGTFVYTPAAGTVLNAGTQPLSVVFTPNNGNYSGSSGSVSLTVNKASQTISFTTSPPSSEVYEGSFTVVATPSSGLPITYTSSGVCTNVNATYTMSSGTGTCTVKANQAGNGNYLASSTISAATTATLARQSVSFSGAPASAGYLATFNVVATTNAPITALITTSSTCSISGTTVTIRAASGTCTMTATWNGNGNYALATATQQTTATKATPTVSWATPAAISYGTALSATQLNATASVAGTFKYTPAAGKILTAGTQTLSVTFTPTPTTDYNTVTTTVPLQVLLDATTTTVTSADATVKLSKAGSAAATLDYNVTSYKPTGSETLTASTGETCTGIVNSASGNGNCKLTFTTTGTRTITATYGGDANHTGSNNSSQTPAITVTVNPYQ